MVATLLATICLVAAAEQTFTCGACLVMQERIRHAIVANMSALEDQELPGIEFGANIDIGQIIKQ